jgi:hypothetical protein
MFLFIFLGFSTPKRRRVYAPRYISEIRTPDVNTPRRASRIIRLVKENTLKQKKRIKALQNANRLLKKKVNTVEKMIEHFKSKEMISEAAADNIMVSLVVNIVKLYVCMYTGCLIKNASTHNFFIYYPISMNKKTKDMVFHALRSSHKIFFFCVIFSSYR